MLGKFIISEIPKHLRYYVNSVYVESNHINATERGHISKIIYWFQYDYIINDKSP